MFKTRVQMPDLDKKVSGAMAHGQKILDSQALKDSNYFIPADTWNLRDSSLIHTKVGSGLLVWNTPYASALYWNPQYNFSEDKNPNASGLWFEEAKAKYLDDWLKQAQKAVRSKF